MSNWIISKCLVFRSIRTELQPKVQRVDKVINQWHFNISMSQHNSMRCSYICLSMQMQNVYSSQNAYRVYVWIVCTFVILQLEVSMLFNFQIEFLIIFWCVNKSSNEK